MAATIFTPVITATPCGSDQDTNGLTPRQIVGILGKDMLSMKVDVFVKDQAQGACKHNKGNYTITINKLDRTIFQSGAIQVICAGDTHYIAKFEEDSDILDQQDTPVNRSLKPELSDDNQYSASSRCSFAAQLLECVDTPKASSRVRIRSPWSLIGKLLFLR